MPIFSKRDFDKGNYTEDDLQLMVETLPGFQGTPLRSTTAVDAIKNTDVFKAVVMIASDLAKMDITVRRNNIIDKEHPFSFLLNKHPNQAHNGYKLKFAFFANALLNRNSYLEIKRANGMPAELINLKPSQVVLEDDGDTIHYKVDRGNGKSEKLSYYDVIDLSFYTLDGFTGISIIDVLAQVIDTDANGKAFLNNFLKNGTHAGGILKMRGASLNKDARNRARDEFQKAMSGTRQAGKVIVLDDTMEYKNLEVDTEVLKLIQNSKPSTSEVAKAFGIPLHKFGIETSSIDIGEANVDYLSNTLGPYMKAVTSELEFQMFTKEENKTYTFFFDANDIKVLDPETQAKVDRELLESGLRTVDELRVLRGLPPIPGGYGSKHRVSLNQVNIELADDYQRATMDNRLKSSVGGGENSEQRS